MSNYIMYPHGGSGNHGCEAIVRSTVAIIEENNSNNEIALYSTNPQQDILNGLDKICSIRLQNKPIKKLSMDYIKALFLRHVLNNKNAFDVMSFKDMFSNSKVNTVALSIGGDNYCYGKPEHIYFMNKYIRRTGAKSILWGCSVDRDKIDEEMSTDLRGYDLIIARESISYEALKKINQNTKLYPDPAFTLDKVNLSLPKGFSEGNTVGINVSPMIIGYEKQGGVAMDNFFALLEHVLSNTEMNIALIPHVVWSNSNDLEPLAKLYDKFKETGRVVLIGNHNCMELKGFISRCRMFIGARTHATIAAYSTCIPTLVVGYSVKALGIARDIFGSEDNMVIPVQNLEKSNELIDAFEYLSQNEDSIRTHLRKVMPEYCSKALESGKEMKKFIAE